MNDAGMDDRCRAMGQDTAVDRLSWRHSLAVRYVALSLVAAVGPLVIVGILYDRFSSDLVERISGERLERRVSTTSARMKAFLDARAYQLDTLAAYPAVMSLLERDTAPSEPTLDAVIRHEADQPDFYGILLFGNDGRLVRAIPGQAAAGSPYWGDEHFSIDGVPRARMASFDLVGPVPPADGQPGSLLLVRDLPSPAAGLIPSGRIALHVRLASLTELLGTDGDVDLVRPLLLAPGGSAYSAVGIPERANADLITGAEVAPGWRPALRVDRAQLEAPLRSVRYALIAALAIIIALTVGLFVHLWHRITRRVGMLVAGADSIAAGDLSWRIDPHGEDEVGHLARAFNAMASRLQHVVRSTVEMEKMAVLGQFATGVAHEIRNPLAAMKTSSQALLPDEQDPERRQVLAGMTEEIDRLEESLDDLLEFARPRPPQHAEVSAEDLLRRLAGMVRRQAKDANVSLDWQAAPGLRIHADAGHVQQILMNLVLNALQAMPGGGKLDLRAHRHNGCADIEVRDTGCGMDHEVLGNLTQPFFTTRKQGTGLGLAISRQLTELNDGRLEFHSEPGRGTRAILSLPCT